MILCWQYSIAHKLWIAVQVNERREEALLWGGGVPIPLVWISKPVVSLIEEETMLLLVFYYCLCFSLWLSQFQPIFVSPDAISAILCQGHVACQNFTLTGSNAGKLHCIDSRNNQNLLVTIMFVWTYNVTIIVTMKIISLIKTGLLKDSNIFHRKK